MQTLTAPVSPFVRRTTGLLLMIVPSVFMVWFSLLAMQFAYPDILRQPTADVLVRFQQGATG